VGSPSWLSINHLALDKKEQAQILGQQHLGHIGDNKNRASPTVRMCVVMSMLRGDNAVVIPQICRPMFLIFSYLHNVTRALDLVFKPLRGGLQTRMDTSSAGGCGRA
jgi:hypothetical protein